MEHCRNYEQSQRYVEPAGHPEVKYLNICSNICSNPEVNYLFKFLFTRNYLMFCHGNGFAYKIVLSVTMLQVNNGVAD